jgi:hypothetical protein
MSIADHRDTSARPPAIPGTIELTGKSVKLQRRIVLLLTVGPFVGLVIALWLLWGRGFSFTDMGIFLGVYAFTGIGVTIGFHRLFTHRSFETKSWLKALFAIAGSMARSSHGLPIIAVITRSPTRRGTRTRRTSRKVPA